MRVSEAQEIDPQQASFAVFGSIALNKVHHYLPAERTPTPSNPTNH